MAALEPVPAEGPTEDEEKLLAEMKRLEALASSLDNARPLLALPRVEYLEATGVISLLLQGIQWLVETRPPDPVEYLAMYLIKNNPAHPEFNQTIDLSEFQ